MREEDIILPSEVAQMIEIADGDMIKSLIIVLWHTGHRVSEIISLTKSDVWYDDKWVFFRFRVLKRRQEFIHTIKVPLAAKHMDELILYCEDKGQDEKLFDITRQYVNFILKNIGEKIGKHIHPHMFRHTLATMFAEKGANKYELDAWFGWSETGNTSGIYVVKGTALIENLANKIV